MLFYPVTAFLSPLSVPVCPVTNTAPDLLTPANVQTPGTSRRTFHGIVLDRQFTVRRLCNELHVAAESLRAAYDEPGRLSLNAVMAFSGLLGEEPEKVSADLFAETRELRKKGPAPEAPKRNRTLKAKAKSDRA